MRGLSIPEHQLEVGLFAGVLHHHRCVIGLAGFLRIAAGELHLAILQKRNSHRLGEALFLGGEKLAVFPKGKPAASVFAEKSLLALGDSPAAAGAFAHRLPVRGEKHLGTVNHLVGPHQVPEHIADTVHELAGLHFTALHLFELVFPFRSQKRRLELLRQNGNQGNADLRGNEIGGFFLFLALHKAGRHQLF